MITQEKATLIIKRAEDKAKELKTDVSIAIVDNAGFLFSFKRMENAKLGPIDIAIKKAKTAALFQKPSHLLGQLSQPNQALYGIEQTNDGLVTFAGGLPILDQNNNCVAAIGVSGSTIANDLEIASVIHNLK